MKDNTAKEFFLLQPTCLAMYTTEDTAINLDQEEWDRMKNAVWYNFPVDLVTVNNFYVRPANKWFVFYANFRFHNLYDFISQIIRNMEPEKN